MDQAGARVEGELPFRETEGKTGRRRSGRGEEGVFTQTGCHNGS